MAFHISCTWPYFLVSLRVSYLFVVVENQTFKLCNVATLKTRLSCLLNLSSWRGHCLTMTFLSDSVVSLLRSVCSLKALLGQPGGQLVSGQTPPQMPGNNHLPVSAKGPVCGLGPSVSQVSPALP